MSGTDAKQLWQSGLDARRQALQKANVAQGAGAKPLTGLAKFNAERRARKEGAAPTPAAPAKERIKASMKIAQGREASVPAGKGVMQKSAANIGGHALTPAVKRLAAMSKEAAGPGKKIPDTSKVGSISGAGKVHHAVNTLIGKKIDAANAKKDAGGEDKAVTNFRNELEGMKISSTERRIKIQRFLANRGK